MSRFGSLIVLAIFSAVAVAQPGADDRKNLQGTWLVASFQGDGKDAPKEQIKDWRIVFADDKMTLFAGAQKQWDAVYKIDSGAKPKTLDMSHVKEGKEDKPQLLIYELAGDILKLGAFEGEKRRPKGFDDKADKGVFTIMTLKRAK